MVMRWVAVSTAILQAQHPWHPHSTGEKACTSFAWIDLIGLANWKDTDDLKRGQLRASHKFLVGRWNWSRGKVGKFLSELEQKGTIERRSGARHQPDILTICNYDEYQNPQISNRSSKRIAKRIAKRTSNSTQEVPVVPSTLDVPTERAAPDVEKWNDRLAPLARELGGEQGVARWLRWAKTRDPDTCEQIMVGFKSLRDRGAISWVPPGKVCTPGTLSVLFDGQPIENAAISEYWRVTSPKSERSDLTRLQA